MKKLSAVLFAAALAFPSTSLAATDGTLGATSSGTVGVSMTGIASTTGSQISITGLQDVDFGNAVVGTVPSPKTINNICVFLTSAATYSISFLVNHLDSGPNAALLYRSSDGLPAGGYTLRYADNNGNSTTLFNGGSGYVGSSTSGCSGGNTASLTVIPSGVTRAGQMSGIITLTVAPD